MSVEQNKDLIRRSVEQSFNARNLDILDEMVAEQYVDHGAFPGQLPGIPGMKQVHRGFYEGFPDVHQTIDDMFAEGDRVVVRWTCRGTHRGMFAGIPPTNRYVTVTGIDIFRIENNRIVECWHNVDELGVLRQLGVFPPTIGLVKAHIRHLLNRLLKRRKPMTPVDAGTTKL